MKYLSPDPKTTCHSLPPNAPNARFKPLLTVLGNTNNIQTTRHFIKNRVFFFLSFKKIVSMSVCTHSCVCTCTGKCRCPGRPETPWVPLERGFQVFRNSPYCYRKLNSGPQDGAARVLDCWAISLAPKTVACLRKVVPQKSYQLLPVLLPSVAPHHAMSWVDLHLGY